MVCKNGEIKILKRKKERLSMKKLVLVSLLLFVFSNTLSYLGEKVLWAAQEGRLSKLKDYLKQGGDANFIEESTRLTPLMEAAEQGFYLVCKELIVEPNCAKLNLQDDDGDTALIKAAREGEPRIVRLLIKSGAKIDIKNEEKRAALDEAKYEFKLVKKGNRKYRKLKKVIKFLEGQEALEKGQEAFQEKKQEPDNQDKKKLNS